MGSRFISWIKEKWEDRKDKKEFERELEAACKPIRRKAYYEERLRQATKEGKNIAVDEFSKIEKKRKEKNNPKKKEGMDFGISTQPLFKR